MTEELTESTILDSGDRREFETGAVRDMHEGKGRCDLLPLDVVSRLIYEEKVDLVIYYVDAYMRSKNVANIKYAIDAFCKKCGWSVPRAMLEVAKHFEAGCKKYGERNWGRGIPEYAYVDSCIRHYLKWLDGMKDEPHDRAVLWNLMCLWWTHEHIGTKKDNE